MGCHGVEPDPVAAAVTRLAREESGRVLALLASRFGDLDVADDAVQDALIEASTRWTRSTIPTNPAGWLMTVASRKAIDSIRRANSRDRRLRLAANETQRTSESPDVVRQGGEVLMTDGGLRIDDDRLRLMFLCCHPAIDRDTQVALTLRLVGGLNTSEIAAAFLLAEPTLAQRIVRVKRKIR